MFERSIFNKVTGYLSGFHSEKVSLQLFLHKRSTSSCSSFTTFQNIKYSKARKKLHRRSFLESFSADPLDTKMFQIVFMKQHFAH